MSAEFLKVTLKWAITANTVPREALEKALAGIIDLLPDHESSVEADVHSDAITGAIVNAILETPTVKPHATFRGRDEPLPGGRS